MKLFIYIAAIFITTASANAQTPFLTSGTVEYEVKINMSKNIDPNNSWAKNMAAQYGNYSTQYYKLAFNDQQSIYKKGKEFENKWDNYLAYTGYNEKNFTLTNFKENTITQFKNIFDKQFLIQDSALKIDWRLMDETREIAGFNCRKAVGRFNDTLYVIAFYSDQIVSQAGPLLFNGLPGLILGIAFPRYNYTIYATKVNMATPPESEFTYNIKKPINTTRKEIEKTTNELMARWGENENPDEKNKAIANILINN